MQNCASYVKFEEHKRNPVLRNFGKTNGFNGLRELVKKLD